MNQTQTQERPRSQDIKIVTYR